MMFPASAKARGHIAELEIATQATRRGQTVLWPGGDNLPFDMVILSPSGKYFKVQVKSCLRRNPKTNKHTFTVKHGGKDTYRQYDETEVDIIALYTFDTQDVYLIPLSATAARKAINIDEESIYYRYKDAWHLLD